MVVVAIVGILAGVALPAYNSYIAKGHRAGARAQLLQAAQYMQRFYAANDRYDADRTGAQTVWQIMPPTLMKSPPEGTAVYEIATSGANSSQADQSTFLLVMQPVAGGPMASDECGSFRISQTGAKTITASTDEALRAKCWK